MLMSDWLSNLRNRSLAKQVRRRLRAGGRGSAHDVGVIAYVATEILEERIYLSGASLLDTDPLQVDDVLGDAVVLHSSGGHTDDSSTSGGSTGQIIVRFTDATTTDARDAVVSALGGTVVKELSLINAAAIQVDTTTEALDDILTRWSNNAAVKYAEVDSIRTIDQTIPNDASFSSLWGLHNTGQTGGTPDADIDAAEAWDTFTGSSNVVIASIDTGVEYTHEDLAANMWINPGEIAGDGIDNDGNGYIDDIYGIDAFNGDSDPMDDHDHGTHTAGTFGAVGDNGIGVAGVNWDVQIMALKFLGAGGTGPTSGAVEVINYMTMMKTQYGVNIVVSCNSWGGGGYSQALVDSIQASINAGIMFVAAAGNDGLNNDTFPHYPSSYDLDGIISVAATDDDDQLASFSNYGATSVDLAAPGVGILSTVVGNGYASFNGTSMATPHVAGAAGMLMALHPEASLADIKEAILSTVDPIAALDGRMVTGGRLNLANALNSFASTAADDHGNEASNATPARVPDTVTGRINYEEDEDWFRFQATAGQTYVFTTGAGSLADTTLTLVNSDQSTVLAFDDDSGLGRASKITWEAESSGIYYLKVAAFGDTDTGTYTLSLQRASEAPVGLAALLGPTGTTTDLTPTFTWNAAPGAASYEIRVDDVTIGSSQNAVVSQKDIVGTSFTPTTDLQAGHSYSWRIRGIGGRGTAGSWSEAAYFSTSASALDDAGNTPTTARTIGIGSWGGSLEASGDVDYLVFNAISGRSYTITATNTNGTLDARLYAPNILDVASPVDTTLSGSLVERVNGTTVALTAVDSFLTSDISRTQTTFSISNGAGLPTHSGVVGDDYYIRIDNEVMRVTGRSGNTLTVTRGVGSFATDHSRNTVISGDPVGGLEWGQSIITVADATRLPAHSGAASDDFTLVVNQEQMTVTAINGNDLTVTRGINSARSFHVTGEEATISIRQRSFGGQGTINFVPLHTGTYYLRLNGSGTTTYNISVSGPIADDYGDTYTTATTIALDEIADGRISTGTDQDWFKFTPTVGHRYIFETTLGSLNDTYLTLYEDNGGTLTQRTVDDDSGVGRASRIVYTATSNNDFYLKVTGYNQQRGTYSLGITEQLADDHGNDSGTATAITMGTPTAGRIEAPGDKDWFQFNAVTGQNYVLEARGGTLADTTITLYRADGSSVLAYNDDGGAGRSGRIEWTATEDSVLYVRVAAFEQRHTGTYTLIFTDDLPDDHGNDFANATPVTVGSRAVGHIEAGQDEDWFSFDATAGTQYVIETILDSLPDTTLTLYDADGTTVLRYDNNSGLGNASRIDWTAGTTDTYFVRVAGFTANQTGTYKLDIGSVVDDHGSNFDSETPGALNSPAPPLAGNSTTAGSIEIRRDTDWFQFNAIDGVFYTFDVQRGTLPAATLELHASASLAADVTASATQITLDNASVFLTNTNQFNIVIGGETMRVLGVNGNTLLVQRGVDGSVAADHSLGDLAVGRIGFSNDDGKGQSPSIGWIANASGTYFLKIQALGATQTGTYQLHVQQPATIGVGTPILTSPTGAVTDTKIPVFTWSSAVRANTYRVRVSDLTTGKVNIVDVSGISGTSLTSPLTLENGHVYVWYVQGFAANGTPGAESTGKTFVVAAADDVGDGPQSATSLTVGTPTNGIINVPGDVDWFKFRAVAGTTYNISSTPGTLLNTAITLYGTNGSTVLQSDTDGGSGAIEWTATSSDIFFLKVAPATTGASGSYTVAVSVPTAVVPAPSLIDHADSGILKVIGTEGDDDIRIDISATTIDVYLNGNAGQHFSRSLYTQVQVDGAAGNDTFVLRGSDGDDVVITTPSLVAMATNG